MTNEEAVKILRRIQDPEAWEPQINGAAFEALDMAIEALGRQQAAGSGGLISRQEAIDAFNTNLNELVVGGEENAKTVLNYLNRVLDKIKCLPSAQPKMGKWIDRGEHGDWEWQADGRGKHWHEWECNTCHHYYAERSFFCPHCGTDMRGMTT